MVVIISDLLLHGYGMDGTTGDGEDTATDTPVSTTLGGLEDGIDGTDGTTGVGVASDMDTLVSVGEVLATHGFALQDTTVMVDITETDMVIQEETMPLTVEEEAIITM